MAALTAGKAAPQVRLSRMDGGDFSLEEARQRGPVVLAFFKISCPVCQYTLPFLERLYKAHRGKVAILGVSQNPKKDTAAFLKEYGITFPVLLDDTRSYPASNAYGITNVPTVFLVGSAGTIEVSSVGWYKHDIERISRRMAEAMSLPPAPVFHLEEQVIDSKAG